MTEKEFLEMGEREQNILITEKIMGWKVATEKWGACVFIEEDNGDLRVFDPVRSVSHAFDVWDKLVKEGYSIFLEQPCGHCGGIVVSVFLGGSDEPGDVEVSALTIPLTICLAALKLKGVVDG